MDYKVMKESLEYGEEYSFVYKDKKYWVSQNENRRIL